MFLVGCTFIDDYDIDLMQDAKASVESSSSVSSTGSSTGSETLSSSAKVRSSSSRNEINSSSAKKVASSSSNPRNDVESSSAKAPSSSSTNPESSNTETAKSSSSQTVNSSGSTVALFKCGTDFVDSEDEKRYATTKIGTQCWFAENLNHETKKSDCYDLLTANCDEYGRLYTWNDAQAVCPEGSHLPGLEDWNALLAFLGNPLAAGFYLKKGGVWDNAEDAFGFSALPAGYYSEDDDEFVQVGRMAGFWSSVDSGSGSEAFILLSDQEHVENRILAKANKLSVRCIVDNFK